MAKIVLAGGTGNLGKLLIPAFNRKDKEIIVLTRKKMMKHHPGLDFALWDGENLGEWCEALEDADLLINLSGESINKRFTPKNKKLLYDSRILPTQTLGRALQNLQNPPKMWINFSGVSIFNGAASLQDESSSDYGDDFLAELSKAWEAACLSAETPKTKKVIVRMSPILSKNSGMFAELKPLAKFGLAGSMGSGKQYMPWIHEDDFIRLILWIAEQENPEGIYHACSPNPEQNKDFMRILRKGIGMPIGLPQPAFVAKVGAFLKGLDPGLLLQTAPVTTNVTLKNGFTFNFAYLHDAINQLVK